MKKCTLEDVCEKKVSNILQKDVDEHKGQYPIFGASGLIGHVDFYEQERPYIAVVKDGAGVGRIFLLPPYSSVIGTMQYILPRNVVYIHYLYYAMQYMNLGKYYKGAAIPHIYFKDYKEEPLKLPTIEIQKKLADNLDSVNRMLLACEKQLAKLDALVKSRFIEMFGDPVTNPMGWEEHRLDEYIRFLTSGSRGWSKFFSDTGAIFITIKNVKNNRISLNNVQYVTPPDNAEAQRTKVREGDLLISITADLGRTGVVSKAIEEQGAYINQHLTCIRLKQDKINPGYVSYFMESDAGKRQFEAKNQAAVKAGLNFDAIKSLKLLVPPLELQNEYMSFVQQVNKSKSVPQKLLEKQQLLRAALMQEYFG